jgi:uncharacterized protein YukE
MDFSKLSYSEITAKADNLKTYSGEMEKILQEVTNQFNKIGTDEVWSGTAASQTKANFDALKAKFPEFYQSVSDCYTYLYSVVENYKAVDAAVGSSNGN